MIASVVRPLWHLVVTPYEPAPTEAGYLERAQVQEDPRARVTVGRPGAAGPPWSAPRRGGSRQLY